jgi:hypothetical protein
MSGGSVLGQVGMTKPSGPGSGGGLEVSGEKSSPKAAVASGPAAVTGGIITGTLSEVGLEEQAAKVSIFVLSVLALKVPMMESHLNDDTQATKQLVRAFIVLR